MSSSLSFPAFTFYVDVVVLLCSQLEGSVITLGGQGSRKVLYQKVGLSFFFAL